MNKFDSCITLISSAWSIVNIESMLGIILLVLSLCNILWKLIFQIYKSIKNKKLDNIENIIDDSIEKIKNLKKDGK